jgi:hypothetical protein
LITHKRTYVQLTNLCLPAGTEIREAPLELYTSPDILARPMPSDNDLTALARPVVMVRFASGSLFPATWTASKP